MKCGLCGKHHPQHALDCPAGPKALPAYSHVDYEADLRREIVAYEARVLTLESENATLRSLLATARGKVGS